LTGVACGASCSLIWGIQAVVSRQSVADDLTATDVTVVRFLVAGLVLFPVAMRAGQFPFGRLSPSRAVIIACLAGAPYSLVLVGGAAFAPAIHSAVIGPGLIPFVAALLAFILFGEQLSAPKLAGLALVVIGVGVFSIDALIGAAAREGAWRGDLLFALTAVMWASFGLLAKRWNVGAVEGTASICVLSLLSMPLWAPLLPMRLAQASAIAVGLQAIYQGLFVGVLSLMLYTRCVMLLGPAAASLFVPLVPIVTALGGVLLLGEQPSISEWVGMVAVVCGMIVALLPGRA
jgi:drug/metabolite transporter (DMT)-like permease